MPGSFTPHSIKGQPPVEEEAVVLEAAAVAPQDTPTEVHGSFSLPKKEEAPQSEAPVPQTVQQEVAPKKISSEDYKTPAFKTIASRVALMPDLIATYKKNINESMSAIELGFYRGSINSQIDTLDSAQRTFKQVGNNGEEEVIAKNLIDTVNSFKNEFEALEKKAGELIAEVKTKRIVGPEICVPLKKEDGNPNPEATALIRDNLSGQAIVDAVAETREGDIITEAEHKTEFTNEEEKKPSAISYAAPPKLGEVPAPIAEKPAEEKPTLVMEMLNASAPKAQTPEHSQEEPVVQADAPSPTPTPVSPPQEKLPQPPTTKEEVKVARQPEKEPVIASPLIADQEEVAGRRVAGLWEKVKGTRFDVDQALVVSLAMSPFPKGPGNTAPPKPQAQEASSQRSSMSLSPLDQERLGLFAQ